MDIDFCFNPNCPNHRSRKQLTVPKKIVPYRNLHQRNSAAWLERIEEKMLYSSNSTNSKGYKKPHKKKR
jgi:hypothetical protein